MNKSVYIYPRIDEKDGSIYFQGRGYKLHLAGQEDIEKNWDRFFYTAALESLGSEEGKKFKEDFKKILQYMAVMNKMGEVTKNFRPFLTLIDSE